jgi:hypothetical protein
VGQSKEKCFFFEKKKQKTFQIAAGIDFNPETRMLPATDKSFLLLFFKK